MASREGTNVREKEASKGKQQHIEAITGGAPREISPSKGTMKRKYFELMVTHKKRRSASAKASDIPMLGFRDNEKVGGTPN